MQIENLTDEELIKQYRSFKTQSGIYSVQEQALKVLINSLYGSIGNIHFRYYDWRNAEAVTAFGRLAIKWGERKVNEWMNGLLKTGNEDYVIAIDTDSLYVDFSNLIKAKGKENEDQQKNTDWLSALADKVIAPKCDDWFNELKEYMNSVEQLMFFDRENISPASFWCCHPDTVLSTTLGNITIEELFQQHDTDSNHHEVESIGVHSYNIEQQTNVVDNITDVMRKWYVGDMYTLKFGSNEVRVTAEHQVLTKNPETGLFDRWVQAQHLTGSDEVLLW